MSTPAQQAGGSHSSAVSHSSAASLSHSSGPAAPARASSSFSVARSSALSADQDLVVDRLEGAVDLHQQPLALGGELDDAAAPVGPVAAAHDQIGVLELVQQRDEVGGVEPERLDQRLLRRGPVILEMRERHEVARAQAERSDGALELPAHGAGQSA